MKFKLDSMYKNIYRDKHMAFSVDKIISQKADPIELEVTWYTLTDKGRYISNGIKGTFYIPKAEKFHYVEAL